MDEAVETLEYNDHARVWQYLPEHVPSPRLFAKIDQITSVQIPDKNVLVLLHTMVMNRVVLLSIFFMFVRLSDIMIH